MKNQNKKFSIPGWYSKFNKVYFFLDFYEHNRHMFYEDRVIDSLYDSYAYYGMPLLWTGGRVPMIENPIIHMIKVRETYDKFNMELRHVFSNCMLDDDALINDYRCNKFVKEYITDKDKVILNHPKLIKHFQNNYPDIPIIYSTTMNIKNIDAINDITETNIYVLNYNYNNDDDYLNKLEHKENIELLCAEPCQPFCYTRKEHYKDISQAVISCDMEVKEYFKCPHHKEGITLTEIMQLPHAITNARVDELAREGFQYFKISGRSLPYPAWLETILYYLALPEYLDFIRQRLLMNWSYERMI